MFSGSMVALVTPMCEQGNKIDLSHLRQLVDFHIEQGTSAMCCSRDYR